MLHTRTHKIEDVHGASALAIYLTCKVNALNAGFRFGGYFWLNDSVSEDAIQEYAIVRGIDGLQVESITIRAGDDPSPTESELAKLIRDVRMGKLDDSEMAARGVFVELPAPKESAAERRAKAEVMAEFGYIAPRLPADEEAEALADLGKFEVLPESPICRGHVRRRGQPCASLGCSRSRSRTACHRVRPARRTG